MAFLTKMLKNYEGRDFVLQQKARVVAIACLLVLAIMPIVLVYSYYLQQSVGMLNLGILVPELVGILLFAGALKLLLKGYYETAAHLIIIISLVIAWTILFTDRFTAVARMDTIVFILGIMAMTALFIYRQKHTVFVYYAINQVLLVVFSFSAKSDLALTPFEVTDYLVDNTIALTFISLIAYNVIAVNKRALERAEKDIQRRKQAERNLQQINDDLQAANIRFATVMDALDARVFVSDLESHEILYANRTIQEQFGDVTGQTCWQTFHPEFTAPCEFCTKHLLTDATGKPTGVEVRECYFPNEDQWYESREQAVQWIDGRAVHMEIATNITEQRKAREKMVETEKMATVGGLAAGMGHELNNPLGIIVQGVQNIKRRLSDKLPQNIAAAQTLGVELDTINRYLQKRKILEYIDGIREAGGRATGIVADMLQFSQKQDSDKTPVNLNHLLDQALEMVSKDYDLKKHYDFKHIKIVKAYAPDLPNINCHPNEIKQVLLNLLMNAAYALSEMQGSGFRPQIDLQTRIEGDWVVLEAGDNGPGIEPGVLKHIFEPFFTTKGPQTGTGLGLSVSYFIIKSNHNGDITATSEPGRGTLVTIRLPLLTAHPANR